MAEMTDAMLVRAALEGDARAFSALVDRHVPPCLRYARRMLGNLQDAEEATQETMVRAHRSLQRFDQQQVFRTWVMSILVNRCRSTLLHRRRRLQRVVIDGDAVGRASVASASSEIELRDALDRAIAQLDSQQREAFLLKHVEELSYDEMVAVTGAGVSALKMRVQRACDRLQLLLKEDRHA
jgi:RNA polymerase sigma-70 factor, ECF subfamily